MRQDQFDKSPPSTVSGNVEPMKPVKLYFAIAALVIPPIFWFVYGVDWITGLAITKSILASIKPKDLISLNTALCLGFYMIIWLYPVALHLAFWMKSVGCSWKESFSPTAPILIVAPIMIPLLLILRAIAAVAGILAVIYALVIVFGMPILFIFKRLKNQN